MNNQLSNKLYATKAEISQLFGVNIKTLGTDMTKMRRSPDFCEAILQVSHKRVYVSIKGYEAYLKAKGLEYQTKQME
ncbi:DNA-binding protein [Lactococcus termiticola]|uniref:DNA-binding protein n=1 Tax=Lactococcus termiticola TaxID=2169526 RepID=A0A2R5HIE8_9LACT|nr:DNA-binding protein [Lactococcus termiticola]GBG97315.1 hypothetical protein NtB2_01454 [Lactococcus termiticola]